MGSARTPITGKSPVACGCQGAFQRDATPNPFSLSTRYRRRSGVLLTCVPIAPTDRHPVDGELDIDGGWNLHPVWKSACRKLCWAPEMPFVPACEPMKVLAGLEVPAKAIERAAGNMAPKSPTPWPARRSKPRQTTGPAHCYPTNHPENVCADGRRPGPRGGCRNRGQDRPNRRATSPHPRRSTQRSSEEPYSRRLSWIGRDGPSATRIPPAMSVPLKPPTSSGYRVYTEAWRRGWEWATAKIVIGDGAVWIWNLADQHFPGAVQIVDLIMPEGNTCGIWPHSSIHLMRRRRD